MSGGFEVHWDGDSFEREFNELASKAIRQTHEQVQGVFDRVFAAHSGQPPAVIVPVLRRELARAGVRCSNAELDGYATAISGEEPVEVRLTVQ